MYDPAGNTEKTTTLTPTHTQGTEGHKCTHTGSIYSNAKCPFEFSRQPHFPKLTRQTNGAEWLEVNVAFKPIM